MYNLSSKRIRLFSAFLLITSGLCSVVRSFEISEVEKYLDSFSSKIGLNGNVLISKNGDVLFSKSYGFADLETKQPLTEKSQFCVGSVTKQFTAAAILKLVEEKKINLNDPIGNYIAALKQTGWAQGVTVKHLLNHTSGIHHAAPLECSLRKPLTTIHEVISCLIDKPSQSKPGELFIYSNDGYLVLGYLIETISGETLNQYLKHKFFEPLKMNSTYLQTEYFSLKETLPQNLASPHQYIDKGVFTKINRIFVDFPFSAGGLITTTYDLKEWNEALYSGKILSSELLSEFT